MEMIGTGYTWRSQQADSPKGAAFMFLAVLIVALCATHPAGAQRGATEGEWRYYGGDSGSTKYSPLEQINTGNVDKLKIAWRWKTEN